MKFSLKNVGVWFWFNSENESEGGVCLRSCTGDDINKIEKRTVTNRVEYKRGQRFEITERNEILYNEMLWNHCIVEWKNVEDEEGKELECNKENKAKLMGSSIAFANFIANSLEKLTETEMELRSAQEKN